MLQLEVVVVVIGLWSEAYFLDIDYRLLGFHLLLLFLLLVDELRVVDKAAYGRLGIGANLHKVNTLLLGQLNGSAGGHDGGLDAVAYDTDFACTNLFVHTVLLSFVVFLH